MEGLEFNYKGEWGLDSQVIFDELGLCWDMEQALELKPCSPLPTAGP